MMKIVCISPNFGIGSESTYHWYLYVHFIIVATGTSAASVDYFDVNDVWWLSSIWQP